MSTMTTSDHPRVPTDVDDLAALYADPGTDRARLRRRLTAQEGTRRAQRLWQQARAAATPPADAQPVPRGRPGPARIGALGPSGHTAAMNTSLDAARWDAVERYRAEHGISRNEVMRRAMAEALARPPAPSVAGKLARRVAGAAVVWIPDPHDRARFVKLVDRLTPDGQAGKGLNGALIRYGVDRLLGLGSTR